MLCDTCRMTLFSVLFVGVSLSEPHIDCDNGPRAQNNGMSVSIFVSFTLCLLHPGSRDLCMP